MGIQSSDTMQSRVQVGMHEFTVLVDSGFTHNFFSATSVKTVGMALCPRQHFTAIMANANASHASAFASASYFTWTMKLFMSMVMLSH